jgi:hypothetical protein
VSAALPHSAVRRRARTGYAAAPPATVAWPVTLLLVVLGGAGVAGSAGWLASVLLGIQVGWFLDDWQTRAQPARPEAYAVAREQAGRAVHWVAYASADDWTRLARVYEWRAAHEPEGAGTWPQERDRALAAYREAARLRPDWHLGWVRLAAFKARHGQIDAEFADALAEALRAGPTRIEGMRVVARLGALHHAALPAPLQAQVHLAAARVLTYSPAEANRLAPALRDAGLADPVCAVLAGRGWEAQAALCDAAGGAG